MNRRLLLPAAALLCASALHAQDAAPAVPPAAAAPAAAPAAEAPAAPPPAAEASTNPCADGADAAGVPQGVVRRAQTAGGTEVQLGISGVSCEVASAAFTEVFALFDHMDKLTSMSGEGSAIKKINDSAGKSAVEVDKETFALVQLAIGFARHTDGAFDPTFAALAGLWTFKAGEHILPNDEEVEARRQLVDWQQVEIDESKRTVFLKKEGMKLGVGGIVKGYTMDQAVTLLREKKVPDFIIKTGGEIYVSGNPGGGYRRVGVPDPRGDGNWALMDVRERALNTSSDNDKFFILDGVRYHHIIDASTGRPARRSRSVSVLSVDATSSDALSTAIFVMGPEKGMALVERLAGVEALIVDDKNVVHVSSGLSDRVVLGAPTDRSP
jgi:thiamine biosynthesis lipoprotein